jgi:hypothetical protein
LSCISTAFFASGSRATAVEVESFSEHPNVARIEAAIARQAKRGIIGRNSEDRGGMAGLFYSIGPPLMSLVRLFALGAVLPTPPP